MLILKTKLIAIVTIGIFLIIPYESIFAQNINQVITGQIIDSATLLPIANAHVVLLSEDKGISTNEEGMFSIELSSFPASLEFQHLNYHSKIEILKSRSKKDLFIKLTPKIYDLSSVTIPSDLDTYNKNTNNFTLLDYNFINNDILILQRKRSLGGRPDLILLNWNFDTILIKTNLPKSSTSIFKDCLNSYHVITKDSAYQIYINKDTIKLHDPFLLNWFNKMMNSCLFEKDSNLYFELSINNDFGHEIIYINREDKTKKTFLKYFDIDNYLKLTNDISHISRKYFLHSIPNASTNDCTIINHIHRFDIENRYLREIDSKPIKNEILILNDTIVYFNYYNSVIQLFAKTNSSPLDIAIDYKTNDGWGNYILVDELQNKIYSVVKNKLFYKVFSVNLKKGSLKQVSELSIFKGDNIKINDGYMYYLTFPSTNSGQVRKLTRVKIN